MQFRLGFSASRYGGPHDSRNVNSDMKFREFCSQNRRKVRWIEDDGAPLRDLRLVLEHRSAPFATTGTRVRVSFDPDGGSISHDSTTTAAATHTLS